MTTPSPMISVPLKATGEIDWVQPLKRYIRDTYGDDPDKYSEECATLNRLRQDMRGAGKESAAGRDILYRYYGQLELLDLRFPVDENHIKISFTWYDAFTHKPTAQYSLAYEKASIIFNISAVLSCHAASQTRTEETGLKTAYHSFQASAGMFTYINENFLHAPSTDLSRDTVKTLIQIMLAQGQEVFLEKQIADGKKAGLLAKLSSQAAHLYTQGLEGVLDNVNRGVFDKSWLMLAQIKSAYMTSLSQYYQALADDDANNHGIAISRLQSAELTAREALKLSVSFPNNLPADANLGSETAAGLQEMTKRQLSNVQDKLVELVKDNDYIYHQTIPAEASLAAVPKLPASKAIPVSELYAGQDIQRITGPDIFQKIVPMAVTESASLYDEEKAKLVRAESEKVETAEGELDASLDYLKLPGALNVLRGDSSPEIVVDSEFRSWCTHLVGLDLFSSTFESIKANRDAILTALDKSSKHLDMEESVCEKMRSKYEADWTQQPSSRLTTTLRNDIRSYREALSSVTMTDESLHTKMLQNHAEFDEMRSAGETGEADVLFQTALLKAGSKGRGSAHPGADGNLLDEDFDDENKPSIMDQVNRVDAILEKLRFIKRERQQTLKDLKDKVHNDDISQVLILNKKSIHNFENQLFQAELEKFRPYQTRLLQATHKQTSLMKDLTAYFNTLLQDKRVRSEQIKLDSVNRQRSIVMNKYKKVYTDFVEIRAGLDSATRWYMDMINTAGSLEKNVETFVNNRRSEGAQLLTSIEARRAGALGSQADREGDRMRTLMERMSVNSPNLIIDQKSNLPQSQLANLSHSRVGGQHQNVSVMSPSSSYAQYHNLGLSAGPYSQQDIQRQNSYSQVLKPSSEFQGSYNPSNFSLGQSQPTSPPANQQHIPQHTYSQPIQQYQHIPAGYVPPPPPPGPPPLGPQQTYSQHGSMYGSSQHQTGYGQSPPGGHRISGQQHDPFNGLRNW